MNKQLNDNETNSEAASAAAPCSDPNKFSLQFKDENGKSQTASFALRNNKTIAGPVLFEGIKRALKEMGINLSVDPISPSPDSYIRLAVLSNSLPEEFQIPNRR